MPSPEELAAQRGKMMAEQDGVARETKIPPDLLARVMVAAGAAN